MSGSRSNQLVRSGSENIGENNETVNGISSFTTNLGFPNNFLLFQHDTRSTSRKTLHQYSVNKVFGYTSFQCKRKSCAYLVVLSYDVSPE